ncbi:hypothetical protein [Streptomyces sp. SID3343]|uniref:hypothetical protein n=1 Tax=Streptomyces sp. SID3343 TaxID=2690260 RepID=UPI00136A026F|nr:hypothetical protein [Streptomyces sp. SID3343]MYV99010.1 hypothetical protein [Streptomyces sp. SID3343]
MAGFVAGDEAVVAELFGGFGLDAQAAGAGRSGTAQRGAWFLGGPVGQVGGAQAAAVGGGVRWPIRRPVRWMPCRWDAGN